MKTITQKDTDIVKKKLNLTKDSKILNISHFACMDGSTATMNVYNNFKNINYIRAKFNEIDNCARLIDYDKYDAVFFTDISPTNPDVISTPKNIVMIDHHETGIIHHDPDNMRFVYNGECASMLTKKFMESYFKRDMSYMDDLIKRVNDYDLWIDPFGEAWGLNLLHYYYLRKDNYTHTQFIKRFCNGDIRLTEDEQTYINARKKELEVNWLRVKTEHYELPSNVNGCLIMESDFVNEMCHRLMSEFKYKIVINKNPRTNQCSVRCQEPTVPVGTILKELKIGGGHDDAAGFYNTNVIQFREQLDNLCEYLKTNYKVM